MILTIELVPSTCWYSNVRSQISPPQWDIIRKQCYRRAGHLCEICGQSGLYQGYKHKVECHEIWQYDDRTAVQTLIGFICLCPRCHEVKHAGLTILRKGLEAILTWLMSVNSCTRGEAADHIEKAFDVWKVRSAHAWKLDISYLDRYIDQWQRNSYKLAASPPVVAAAIDQL